MMKFLLEEEVYLMTMEVNNTTPLVNIFDFIFSWEDQKTLDER